MKKTKSRAASRTHTSAMQTGLTALVVSVAVALGSLPQPAFAQDTNVQFSIFAQPLSKALLQFGEQASLQIFFSQEIVEGYTAPALAGNLQPDEGLRRLLAGTGIEFRRTGKNVSLSRPASGEATELAPIMVQGASNLTTEGTGSYTATGSSTAATKLGLTLQETPQSVSVITRQRMDDQRLDTVNQVLETAAGITSWQQSVGSDLEQAYSRGFLVSNYMIDGLPVASGINTRRMGTAMFDRVEVVQGATGLTSGMGRPGAAVYLTRKRPTPDFQASVGVEAGNWDRYGGNLDVSGPLSEDRRLRGRLVADHKDQGSWLDRYEYRSSLLYGISEFDVSSQTLLTAGFSLQRDRHDSPLRSGNQRYYSDGTAIGLPRSYNNAPDWTYYNTDQYEIFAFLDHEFDNGWKGKAAYNYSHEAQDALSYYQDGSVDAKTGLGSVISPAKWKNKSHTNSLDVYANGPFDLFGRKHELVVGASFSRRETDTDNYGSGGWLYSWNSDYDGTLGNIWNWDGSGANTPTYIQNGHAVETETQVGAYATSRWSLTDKTTLIAGGRITNWERTTDSHPFSGAASSIRQKEQGVLVPYAGLVYALNDAWSVYGSYTKIFNPQTSSVRDQKNNHLDPEGGTAYEIGAKAALAMGLDASIAFFKVEQDNVAQYDSSISAYRQLEGIRTQGMEVQATGELAKGLNVTASYTYSTSKDRDGVRVMAQFPRHTIKSFMTYRLPADWHRLTVGGGLTWKGRWRSEFSVNSGNSSFYPEHGSSVLANLFARYEFDKNWSATLNVNNLFDKKYYAAIAGNNHVYGEPRSVMASIKYRF